MPMLTKPKYRRSGWLALILVPLLVSCGHPRVSPPVPAPVRTTDSLAFDMLGLRLGETYAGNDLFDTLKSRITDLTTFDDWHFKTPYFHHSDKDILTYYVNWHLGSEPYDFNGILWAFLFLDTTPEGVLYEISLHSMPLGDKASVESAFKNITSQLAQSFGDPVYEYHYLRKHATKFLSFRTGRIEQTEEEVSSTPYSATWFDGFRELSIYDDSLFGDSSPTSLNLRFEDKSIKSTMVSPEQETKQSPR